MLLYIHIQNTAFCKIRPLVKKSLFWPQGCILKRVSKSRVIWGRGFTYLHTLTSADLDLHTLTPADLDLHNLTPADLDLHILTPADLDLHTLTPADLDLHTLTSADLHHHTLTPADLDLHTFTPADLDLHTFTSADLLSLFFYSLLRRRRCRRSATKRNPFARNGRWTSKT